MRIKMFVPSHGAAALAAVLLLALHGAVTAAEPRTWIVGATVISPASIFIAAGVAAAIGIFFGFYPARQASLLDPIDALRYE